LSLSSRLAAGALGVSAAAALACGPITTSYDEPTGPHWTEQVAIGPTGNWTAPRLGADAEGNVIAVWAARGGGGVWAARRRGGRWSDPVRIGLRQTADRVELTVRSDGTAIAGWIGDIDLVVARFDPSRGWEAPEVAASPSGDAVAAWLGCQQPWTARLME